MVTSLFVVQSEGWYRSIFVIYLIRGLHASKNETDYIAKETGI